MIKSKVIKVNDESITFDCGATLASYHEQDCCEHHYLSFDNLDITDFDGLEFDLSNDKFFNRIENFGIELVPLIGFTVKVPGYGINNGYYTSNLSLVLIKDNKEIANYEIDECQLISD
jgi:hypothetical protein